MKLSDANSAWAIAWSGSIWISSKDKITNVSNAISDKTELRRAFQKVHCEDKVQQQTIKREYFKIFKMRE